MSAPRSKSTKELLAAAKLPERSVSICLRGDLVADIERLEADLAAALDDEAANKRLNSKGAASKKIAAKIEAKKAEMGDAMLNLRLRAMVPADWRKLKQDHPPKKGDESAVNLDTFFGAAIPASVVEPDDMDADDWATLNANVADVELSRLANAVWELNERGVEIPKSRLASVVNRMTSDG